MRGAIVAVCQFRLILALFCACRCTPDWEYADSFRRFTFRVDKNAHSQFLLTGLWLSLADMSVAIRAFVPVWMLLAG
jgi:hypothetical protein